MAIVTRRNTCPPAWSGFDRSGPVLTQNVGTITRITLLLAAALRPVLAQQQQPDALRSPEMHSDGRVTLRIRAPKIAKEVVVNGISGGKLAMQKKVKTAFGTSQRTRFSPPFIPIRFGMDALSVMTRSPKATRGQC